MKISWSTTGVSSSVTPLHFIMYPNQHFTVFEKSFLIYYKTNFGNIFIFRREKRWFYWMWTWHGAMWLLLLCIFFNCSFDTKSCVQMVQISLSWDIEFQTWNWYLGNYAKLKGTSFKIKIQTIKLQICLLPAVLVSWHHISVLIWLVR